MNISKGLKWFVDNEKLCYFINAQLKDKLILS